MTRKKGWMIIALSGLGLSVVSLFLPILVIQYSGGRQEFYNILRLFRFSDFTDNVLSNYTGVFFREMSENAASSITLLLAATGVVAIVLAFTGILSMNKQYESVWPFVLAIVGLVCTAVPALSILIIVLVFKAYFLCGITAGAYVYITPLAMVASCAAVTARHRLSQKERRLKAMAAHYIRPAGDL